MNLPMNNATMSSVEIAKVTGALHKNVMRDIRAMESAWEKFSGRKFEPANYVDAQGKPRPCYQLTKTECLYVATKFNDEARAKLVLRWEALEHEAIKVHEEYGRRIELLESGVGTLIGAMTNLTTMIAATLQPAAPQLQTIAKPTPHPQGSRAMLVNLVERAVAIAGSQVNLTNWMGVSESVISDIKSTRFNRPGKVMTNYFIDCCNKVVQLGRVPDELPVKPKGIHRRNRTNKANFIADICKIKDDNLRITLLNKVTGGHAL